MNVIGKKYICDRCKAEAFVRYIGTSVNIAKTGLAILIIKRIANWTIKKKIITKDVSGSNGII